MSKSADDAGDNDVSNYTKETADCTAEYLCKMVDKTVAMEEARCESLKRMCDGLLTGSSIVSVALLAVAEPLFGFFRTSFFLHYMLLFLYAIIIVLLLLSMILAVISMARFKYTATAAPAVICDAICSYDKPLSEINAAKSYAETQEKLYQGYLERNNKMRGLLVVAQWVLVAALVITVVGGLVLLGGGLALLG